MVGGANGRVDTGWHVDAGGAPINRFHLTNMMAMGLELPDIEKNGSAGFGEIGQPRNTGDGSNSVINQERDRPDSSRRYYQTNKKDHFAQASERRKPFPYLKV